MFSVTLEFNGLNAQYGKFHHGMKCNRSKGVRPQMRLSVILEGNLIQKGVFGISARGVSVLKGNLLYSWRGI